MVPSHFPGKSRTSETKRKEISDVSFRFEKPEEIAKETLSKIEYIILNHGAVGRRFVRENLENAFLISYAEDTEGNVIGTVILKRQKERYREKIEAVTGLDLSGYLERGYTSVLPKWRGLGIAGKLISGLVERANDQRVYVTIDLENGHALELTRKNGMILAARFFNHRTGRDIGVFVNRLPSTLI